MVKLTHTLTCATAWLRTWPSLFSPQHTDTVSWLKTCVGRGRNDGGRWSFNANILNFSLSWEMIGHSHNLYIIRPDKICGSDKVSNIFKCQAHRYQARRRWRSVCAKGSEIQRIFLQLQETNLTFNVKPWPKCINKNISHVSYINQRTASIL